MTRPTEGGSYILQDGKLLRVDETPPASEAPAAEPHEAEAAAGAAASDAAGTSASTTRKKGR